MRRSRASQGQGNNSSKVPQKNAQVMRSGRSNGGGKRKTAADDSSFEKPNKLMKNGVAGTGDGPSPSTSRSQLESMDFEETSPNSITIKQEDTGCRDLLKYGPMDQNTIPMLIKVKKESPHEVKLGQLKRTNSGEIGPDNRRDSISMHSLDLISHSEELLIKEKKSLEALIDLRNEEIQELLAKIQEEQSKQKDFLGQISKFQIPN